MELSSLPGVASVIAGVAIVLLTLADIFITVLYARTSVELLMPRLYRLVWRFGRAAVPRDASWRDRLLSFVGPVLLVGSAATWVILLVLGFGLMAWPALGEAVRVDGGGGDTGLLAAFYYSGYTLTTLGLGPLIPQGNWYRFLTVVESAVGFGVITLALTYFMSVYAALVRRNAFAQVLHHLTKGTGDSTRMLRALAGDGSFPGALNTINAIALSVLDLLEVHRSYPVLHYFRMTDRRYGTARTMLLVLDATSMLRARIPGAPRSVTSSSAVLMAWSGARELVKEYAGSLHRDLEEGGDYDADRRAAAAHRFEVAVSRLEGLPAAEGGCDHGRALDAFLEMRCQWESHVRTIAKAMDVPWDVVEPACDRDDDGDRA